MRVVAIAAVAGAIALASCEGQAEPAAPPTTEDALTTTTAAPATTPDEAAVTTEAAPTTEEPPAEEPAEAEGPPEMPAEAMEQTEAGAEAFALHYIDLVNYTGNHPSVGLLEPWAADSCATCANYEDNVGQLDRQGTSNNGDAATVHGAQAISQGGNYIVLVDLEQNNYSIVDSDGTVINEYARIPGVQFKFTLVPADPFIITEIQVSTAR